MVRAYSGEAEEPIMTETDDYTWIVQDGEDDFPGWQDWHACVDKITEKLKQAEGYSKKAKKDKKDTKQSGAVKEKSTTKKEKTSAKAEDQNKGHKEKKRKKKEEKSTIVKDCTRGEPGPAGWYTICLLYTSDAADE